MKQLVVLHWSLWLLFDLPLHHEDTLFGTDDGVMGDGMTKSVTLVADDTANGSLQFEHFRGC